ncbi:MAG: serine hydrolase domain-containing protein [Alkalilacustris sp.]
MTIYWPTATDWRTAAPADSGLASGAFDAAVRCALDGASTMNRDIAAALADGHFGEPWPISQTIGPIKERGDPNGLILRGGEIVARWGDVARVDMTFSVTKSYLALCAGLAVDDGLIPDIDAPVRDLVDDGGFDSPQNRSVTWAQLLQLTSEWEGELWGKPDWVDHNRDLSARPGEPSRKGQRRAMLPPGTHWEYNDVRVNRLALALMRVFRRPLPEVLKERVMDPIGASDTWQWHGYDNSWIEIDGRRMQSVSGGAHWGGGLWINTLDHARVGLMMLRGGAWNGRRILSEAWVRTCLAPSPLNPNYGCLWWLNTDGAQAPAASRSSFFALGVGSNIIWVDPDHDLVAVVRWIEKSRFGDFAAAVTEAVRRG